MTAANLRIVEDDAHDNPVVESLRSMIAGSERDALFIVNDDGKLEPLAQPNTNIFSAGRDAARENPGLVYAFAGKWPDDKKRIAVTTVPDESVRASVSQMNALGVEITGTNSFTDDRGGVTFLDHTVEL